MKPAEILKRLDKAKELIAAFPEDIDILYVIIDDGQYSHICLGTPIQRLVEENVIEDGSWETEDDPECRIVEDSFFRDGFSIFYPRGRDE